MWPTCGFLPDLEATLDLALKTEGRLEDSNHKEMRLRVVRFLAPAGSA